VTRWTRCWANGPSLLAGPDPPSRHHLTGRCGTTFHLLQALVEEARNATVALSGPPTRLTLARLVEEGLRREIQRLRDAHNAGSPFPPRDAELIGDVPSSRKA
jgi:hypothetical protein